MKIRTKTRLIALSILAVLLPAQISDAAEIKNTLGSKTNPAYLKKIPGSTNSIQGSRARTYLKPRKQTYQQHMASLSQHRFKNESSSFGYRTKDNNAAASGRVLKSAPPSSNIRVHQRIGSPASGMSAGNQPLTTGDFQFLDRLSATLGPKDPALASRLNDIAAGQKQNRTLTKAEYETLMGMSRKIDDGQASYRLHSIAEKRRETLY